MFLSEFRDYAQKVSYTILGIVHFNNGFWAIFENKKEMGSSPPISFIKKCIKFLKKLRDYKCNYKEMQKNKDF